VRILPFLDDDARYQTFDMNKGFLPEYAPPNHGYGSAYPGNFNRTQQFTYNADFVCPSFRNRSKIAQQMTNYMAVMGGGDKVVSGTPTYLANAATTSNRRVSFRNGVMPALENIRIKDVTDGTSSTYMVGESRYQLWMNYTLNDNGDGRTSWASTAWDPGQNDIGLCVATGASSSINAEEPNGGNPETGQTQLIFGSDHPRGCTMMYADGAVVFMSEELDINIHRSLGKRADGNPFGKAP
jgi:hypothetical protein